MTSDFEEAFNTQHVCGWFPLQYCLNSFTIIQMSFLCICIPADTKGSGDWLLEFRTTSAALKPVAVWGKISDRDPCWNKTSDKAERLLGGHWALNVLQCSLTGPRSCADGSNDWRRGKKVQEEGERGEEEREKQSSNKDFNPVDAYRWTAEGDERK